MRVRMMTPIQGWKRIVSLTMRTQILRPYKPILIIVVKAVIATILPFACIVTTSTEYHSPLVVVGVGTLQGAPTVRA